MLAERRGNEDRELGEFARTDIPINDTAAKGRQNPEFSVNSWVEYHLTKGKLFLILWRMPTGWNPLEVYEDFGHDQVCPN